MGAGSTESNCVETRIGVVSDTHGRLNGALYGLFDGVSCIFHAGDIGRREVIRELEMIAPVYAIRGNTDPYDFPFPEILTTRVGDLSVHVRHMVATSTTALYFFTQRVQADVVLFGHTHEPFLSMEKRTLFLNPGSASKSRSGADTAAIITVKGDVVSAAIHDLIAPEYRARMWYPRTEAV